MFTSDRPVVPGQVLDSTECLIVTGCERFSQFEGYADSFKWTAKATDPTPADAYGRRMTQVVALDAIHFRQVGRWWGWESDV